MSVQAENPRADDRAVNITRVFDAPRELVFRAWTDAEHFAQWCAPAQFAIVRNSNDARRGGVWWSEMRAPDGEECLVSGVYREVIAPKRLVFTYAHRLPDGSHGPETLVTVIFEEVSGGTRITLHQALFDTVENRVAHDMGWSQCLDRLDAYLPDSRKQGE